MSIWQNAILESTRPMTVEDFDRGMAELMKPQPPHPAKCFGMPIGYGYVQCVYCGDVWRDKTKPDWLLPFTLTIRPLLFRWLKYLRSVGKFGWRVLWFHIRTDIRMMREPGARKRGMTRFV